VPRVSVVLETDSVEGYDVITIRDCLDALARQSYPRELIEVVVVDGGKVAGLESIVGEVFPAAVIVKLPGGRKFEQKNAGMKVATGDIVAFLDSDCAPARDWLSTVVRELAKAPPEVAGVQGITVLSDGFLSRELSAFFYGTRTGADDRHSARLLTDNCALRREIAQRFAFEHASFSTVADSLLLKRLTRDGYRILLCDEIRMVHSYPDSAWDRLRWVLTRAYGVGYYMVKARQLHGDLPGASLVRWGGIGWPALAVGKFFIDFGQVWANRRRVGARPLAALPALLGYEIVLFLGGLGALLRLPPPAARPRARLARGRPQGASRE